MVIQSIILYAYHYCAHETINTFGEKIVTKMVRTCSLFLLASKKVMVEGSLCI